MCKLEPVLLPVPVKENTHQAVLSWRGSKFAMNINKNCWESILMFDLGFT